MKKGAEPAERMLAEQAVRTGIPYQKLYHALLRGHIPARRNGKLWIVKDADVDRFARKDAK